MDTCLYVLLSENLRSAKALLKKSNRGPSGRFAHLPCTMHERISASAHKESLNPPFAFLSSGQKLFRQWLAPSRTLQLEVAPTPDGVLILLRRRETLSQTLGRKVMALSQTTFPCAPCYVVNALIVL